MSLKGCIQLANKFPSPPRVPVIVLAEPLFAYVCYLDNLFLRFQMEIKIFFFFSCGVAQEGLY
jgi:hypothetical protein